MANYGTLSADGDTDEFTLPPNGAISVSGTWGSGTITIKVKDGGGTYRSLSTTYTADFDKVVHFERPVSVKLALSGSSTPSLVWFVL